MYVQDRRPNFDGTRHWASEIQKKSTIYRVGEC